MTRKILSGLFALTLMASGAYATEVVTSTKPMTENEFLSAPEQHGLSPRMAAKKYEVYRRTIGSIPRPNLDKSRLRSDEVRNRY